MYSGDITCLTCNFQRALRGMGDGGRHAYRRVTTLLEASWLTQTLRLLQLSFTAWLFAETRRLLSPLAGGLRLETPRVITATTEFVAGFAIFAVPRQSALHQGALLCIGAELQREEEQRHSAGRHQSWSVLSTELTAVCNLCFISAAFQWEGGRDRMICHERIKENHRGKQRMDDKKKKKMRKSIYRFNTFWDKPTQWRIRENM